MNGIVSDRMTESGILYKKNYGVAIPRIKEIAASYSKNHDLAQRLWLLQIRETMIMATLLEPTDKFTFDLAIKWISQFDQIEMVEQTTMNLLCKLPFASTLAVECVNSDGFWFQVTGFILAARIFDKINTPEMEFLIEKALVFSTTNELHLYKAVGLCLSRFCRTSNDMAEYILEKITTSFQSNSIAQNYILDEVKQEILFLNIL
jgi:3-methyladenine DNA glycosylase AlkD